MTMKITNCIRNFFKKAPFVCLIWTICLMHSGSILAQSEEVQIFKKHNGPVKAIAIRSDDKMLATGGDDKMIYIWDLKTGEMLHAFMNEGPIKTLQFTPEGLMASCGSDIKLMDYTGKLIQSYKGYTTDIWSLSYNQKAQKVTAGSYAKYVKIWDYHSGNILLTLEGHERSCLPVCFNPAGNLIATGSLDKSVRTWDAQSGKELHKLQIHTENIFAISFHPSGHYFASASADKTIRLWNADSGKIVRTYIGHKAAVFDVQFSPDGNHMLSCDADKVVILWETATGKKLYVFAGHTAPVNSVRFTHDGNGFVSASDDQTVRYWMLDKKIYLAGTYYEDEIEKEITGSELFKPRAEEEGKQEYQSRVEKADQFLNDLYAKYYLQYIEMLNRTPIQ